MSARALRSIERCTRMIAEIEASLVADYLNGVYRETDLAQLAFFKKRLKRWTDLADTIQSL